CVGGWLWMRRLAGTSDVLQAEGAGWRIAALRGVGMLVGFIALLFVARSPWSEVGPYIDPVMVIIVCAALSGGPITMVKGTVIELTEGAPPSEIAQAVRRAVTSASATYRPRR